MSDKPAITQTHKCECGKVTHTEPEQKAHKKVCDMHIKDAAAKGAAHAASSPKSH